MNKLLITSILILCVLLASAAAAQDCTPVEWVGTQADWSDGPSWSSGAEPNSDNCVTIAAAGVVEVTQADETCAELTLGASDATGGAVQMWFGAGLDVAGSLLVGNGGVATFTQFGGTCSAESVALGTGGYVQGGGLLTTGSMLVGSAAIVASFSISGGTANVTGDLEIGSLGLVVVGSGILDVGGTVIVGGRFSVSAGLSPTIDAAALTVVDGGTIAPFVSEFGLTAIEVSGTAQLAATLNITDFEAPNGTWNVIEAGDLQGTFATVQLPSDDWSWGIEGDTVWIRKDVGTPVETTPWSEVKSIFRPARR